MSVRKNANIDLTRYGMRSNIIKFENIIPIANFGVFVQAQIMWLGKSQNCQIPNKLQEQNSKFQIQARNLVLNLKNSDLNIV